MSTANNGLGSAMTQIRTANRSPSAAKPKTTTVQRDTPTAGIASSDTVFTKIVPPPHLPNSPGARWKLAVAPVPVESFALDTSTGNIQTGWRRLITFRYAPSLVSLIVHCAAVIILGLVTIAAQDSRGTFLSGAFSEDTPLLATAEVLTQLADPEPPSSEDPNINTSGGFDDSLGAANVALSDGAGSASTFDEDIFSSSSAARGGGGSQELADLSGHQSASFFGLSAKGKRFVFVIDSSTSMWGSRWIDVRKELIRSVRKLQPDQYFFVVCFDVTSLSMFGAESPQNDFASGSEENFRKLEYWLSQHTLGPGTRAVPAVGEALRLKPDAIFLLTDGEFQDNVLQTLRTSNRNKVKKRKTPVNTIGFHSEVGAPLLSQIASENNGQFRYVPPPPDMPIVQPMRPFGRGARVYPPQTIQELMPKF